MVIFQLTAAQRKKFTMFLFYTTATAAFFTVGLSSIIPLRNMEIEETMIKEESTLISSDTK
ncbi:hypothetical protein PCANB_000009 [Pneumocystis canis]|nr:hypothetical protein PCANB_000009 [Pneumocystis canis]